jgi:hypothetical protein
MFLVKHGESAGGVGAEPVAVALAQSNAMRRALTWLVAVPLIVVGSQVAHGVAYWWTYPQASLRLSVLQHSGHAYEAYAPAVLGFLGALEVLVFVIAVLDRVRSRTARPLPPWIFLVLPVLAFTMQEHLERLFASGVFPWWTVLEPTYARGILLQIPLGLVAYLIARLLLRTAEAVAQIVRARGQAPPCPAARPSNPRRPLPVPLPRVAPIALAAAGRAPPRLLVVR